MRKRNALKYYPGYYKSRSEILEFTDAELYELLDALYGRDNLPDEPTHSDLLHEALQQHQMDWLTPEGKQEKEYLQKYAQAHHSNPPSNDDTFYAYMDMMHELIDGWVHQCLELRKKKNARQPWRVMPAQRIQKIWNDYAKTGIIRDEAGVEELASIAFENISKLWINAESDFAIGKLQNAGLEIFAAQTAEEKVLALDKLLNIAHQRSDLASWFVEGGRRSLDHLSKNPGRLKNMSRDTSDRLAQATRRKMMKPFVCEICAKYRGDRRIRFRELEDLRAHMLKVHPKQNPPPDPPDDEIIPDGDGYWILD